MGSGDSKECPRYNPYGSYSNSPSHRIEINDYEGLGDQQSPNAQSSYYTYYNGQQQFPANHHQPQSYGSPLAPEPSRRAERRLYSGIADNYKSLEQVTDALAWAGLKSSKLIVGIDFTKSNEWTGARSFQRRSLHQIGEELNPYEEAIGIIGKTLSSFDEDNMIPCYGFGDASTNDKDVFSFNQDYESYRNGFEGVLERYRVLVPRLQLAGPTSFAPIIEMGITVVEQSGGQHYALVIFADGQVTRSIDTETGTLSPQEKRTVEAIVNASQYPLSIILVGVGDGPWDMSEFYDKIPARVFDNFQFVNFTEIMAKNMTRSKKEIEFALSALTKIPSQYKAAIDLNILGVSRGNSINRVPLPPPCYSLSSFGSSIPSHSTNYHPTRPSVGNRHDAGVGGSASAMSYSSSASSSSDNRLCCICFNNPRDMAFGCGHQTCCECGQVLELCPFCRSSIQTRIKLY